MFEEKDRQQFSSRKNDKNENECFIINEMSGGKFKSGEFKLFINRSDKRKGLVINSPQDIPALLMLLKRVDQKYNP